MTLKSLIKKRTDEFKKSRARESEERKKLLEARRKEEFKARLSATKVIARERIRLRQARVISNLRSRPGYKGVTILQKARGVKPKTVSSIKKRKKRKSYKRKRKGGKK